MRRPKSIRYAQLVGKRLVFGKRIEQEQKSLDQMLRILWTAGLRYARANSTPLTPETGE